jgi:hypothetical protein
MTKNSASGLRPEKAITGTVKLPQLSPRDYLIEERRRRDAIAGRQRIARLQAQDQGRQL